MNNEPSAGATLCYGDYVAKQLGDLVFVTATGTHLTTGYGVFWSQIPGNPTELALWHIAPAGIAGDAITPFAVTSVVDVDGPIQAVNVVDANGQQAVAVTQVTPWNTPGATGANVVKSFAFSAKTLAPLECRKCVRNTVAQWCGLPVNDMTLTLKDYYEVQNGPCNNGALNQLTQNLNQAGCGRNLVAGQLSASMPVRRVALLVCGV
jgi:hypothetical protein